MPSCTRCHLMLRKMASYTAQDVILFSMRYTLVALRVYVPSLKTKAFCLFMTGVVQGAIGHLEKHLGQRRYPCL